ncbi:MAG TPA: aromatase/cyclase [Pseudonocardiaceae bacterium]|jgi:ribosome-associated toxin RatA of RatAB toxin-antitoxin module
MTSFVTDDDSAVTSTHTAFVAAPPRAVYELIADVTRWPYIFPSIVHVERLAGGATSERLRLWTVGNGAVRSCVSRRTLDPDGLRIRFRQEPPWPPVAAMSGEWVFIPLPGEATSVVLLHGFRAIGDDEANTALIKQAVDRSSTAELAALKSTAELGDRLQTLVHSFADSMIVKAPLGTVYEFLYRVQDWPQRLPHVRRLIADEAVPNVQTVEMDATVADGSTHTTRMVRVCFPYHNIVYKQTQPPDVLAAHLGGWHLFPTADGVRLTAHNTVMIRPGKADTMLGQNGTVERARELVRQGLRRHCVETLAHAKHLTESLNGYPPDPVVEDGRVALGPRSAAGGQPD